MTTMKQSFAETVKVVSNLTGVTQKDFDVLRQYSAQIMEWKDELVTVFYDTLFSEAKTAAIFKDGERNARENQLAGWLEALTKVDDVQKFWQIQGHIAFAHVRRHVRNEYMVSIYSKMQEFLWGKALTTLDVENGLLVGNAISRVLNTVIGITVALYDLIIEEVTGASPELIENLIATSLDELQQSFNA